jgi:hypothetical protein
MGFKRSVKLYGSEVHNHKIYGEVGRLLLELGQSTLFDKINEGITESK